jgi:hypothetical protein
LMEGEREDLKREGEREDLLAAEFSWIPPDKARGRWGVAWIREREADRI